MIAAIIVLGAALLGALAMLYLERESTAKLLAEQAIAWHKERQELLNRIQRPELLPAFGEMPRLDPEELERKRKERREFNRVGTIAPLEDD